MGKKDRAIEFLKLASSGKVKEAYDNYVHKDFIHHNAYFKGDRETLMKGMEEAHITNPNEFLKVHRALEEDDLVAVHSHVKQKNGNDISVVHIFRFSDDKIIELWDTGMLIPKDSPNENGVF